VKSMKNKALHVSTLSIAILLPVLITGCEGGAGGEWGGTALTALIQSFSEAIYMVWLKILQWAAGLIVVVTIIWLFLRKK